MCKFLFLANAMSILLVNGQVEGGGVKFGQFFGPERMFENIISVMEEW